MPPRIILSSEADPPSVAATPDSPSLLAPDTPASRTTLTVATSPAHQQHRPSCTAVQETPDLPSDRAAHRENATCSTTLHAGDDWDSPTFAAIKKAAAPVVRGGGNAGGMARFRTLRFEEFRYRGVEAGASSTATSSTVSGASTGASRMSSSPSRTSAGASYSSGTSTGAPATRLPIVPAPPRRRLKRRKTIADDSDDEASVAGASDSSLPAVTFSEAPAKKMHVLSHARQNTMRPAADVVVISDDNDVDDVAKVGMDDDLTTTAAPQRKRALIQLSSEEDTPIDHAHPQSTVSELQSGLEDDPDTLLLHADILAFFNDAPTAQLIDATACSTDQAAILAALRPFSTYAQLTSELEQTRGLGVRLIDRYVEMTERYRTLDRLVAKCGRIGAQLTGAMRRWMGTSAGAESVTSGEQVDAPFDENGLHLLAMAEDCGDRDGDDRATGDKDVGDEDDVELIRNQPDVINADLTYAVGVEC